MVYSPAFIFSSGYPLDLGFLAGLRLLALRQFAAFFVSIALPRLRCAFSRFAPIASLGFALLAAGSNRSVKPTRLRRAAYFRSLEDVDLNPNRYLYVLNLEDSTSSKSVRPSDLPEIDDAYVESFGKCATIEMPEGVLYVVGHSRCGPKMWLLASGSDENRPNAPWAAFRGFGHEKAAALAWSWLSAREIL